MKGIASLLLVHLCLAAAAASASQFSVDESTIYASGGQVGIDTAAPVVPLDVNGDTLLRTQLIVVGTATVHGTAFSIGGSTFVVGGGTVVINGGPVGNFPALTINAPSGQQGIGDTNPIFRISYAGAPSGDVYVDANNGLHIIGVQGGGEVDFASDGSINLASYGSNDILLTGGNVGIGAPSPADKLDVNSPGSTLIGVEESGVAVGFMGSAAGVVSGAPTSDMAFASNGDTPLHLVTNSTDRIYIAGGGNVGIGTTSPATLVHMSSGALTIDGNDAESMIATGSLTSASSVTASAFFGDASHLSGLSWQAVGSVVDLVNASNNVVIQSTLSVQGSEFSVGGSTFVVSGAQVTVNGGSPSAFPALIVNGAAGQYGPDDSNPIFRISSDGGPVGDAYSSNGNDFAIRARLGGGEIQFPEDGTVRLVPNTDANVILAPSNGLVGIGTTGPVTPLDVAGDTHISGQLILGGTITVLGNALSVDTSSFTILGGSGTLAYQWSPGSENLSGVYGTITTQSSVTASAFFGDGSHLTGVAMLPALHFSSFTASGTFSPPAGVTTGYVMVVGGGGGGGYASVSDPVDDAGGGGGGQVVFTTVTFNGSVTITIGAGGTGGTTSAGNGGTGGTSSYDDIQALGGGGGGGDGYGTAETGTTGSNGPSGGGGGICRSNSSAFAQAGGGGGVLTPGGQTFQFGAYGNALGFGGNGTPGQGNSGGGASESDESDPTGYIAANGSVGGLGVGGPLFFNQTIMYGAGGGGGLTTNGWTPTAPQGYNGGAGAGGLNRYGANPPCSGTWYAAPTAGAANTGQGGGGAANASGNDCSALDGAAGGSGYVLIWWYQ